MPFIDFGARTGYSDDATMTTGSMGADNVHASHGTNLEVGRNLAGVIAAGSTSRELPVTRTAAYLAANPTLPGVPNDSIVFITP